MNIDLFNDVPILQQNCIQYNWFIQRKIHNDNDLEMLLQKTMYLWCLCTYIACYLFKIYAWCFTLYALTVT